MSAMVFQITKLIIVYSAVYLSADQRKYQSSTSLAFVRGIHRWPVNSPHKGPVTRKMFSFDDVIMFVVKRRTWNLTITKKVAGEALYSMLPLQQSYLWHYCLWCMQTDMEYCWVVEFDMYIFVTHCLICNKDLHETWAPFQYPIRRLFVRSREVSKSQDWYNETCL